LAVILKGIDRDGAYQPGGLVLFFMISYALSSILLLGTIEIPVVRVLLLFSSEMHDMTAKL